MASLGLLVGQDLYEAGMASTDLRNVDQHGKRVDKVRERPRGDKKKVKTRERSVWMTGRQM